MARVPNGIETLPKISTGWVGHTNVTDRQTTDDGWVVACSERECEFTFAENIHSPTPYLCWYYIISLVTFLHLPQHPPCIVIRSFSLFQNLSQMPKAEQISLQCKSELMGRVNASLAAKFTKEIFQHLVQNCTASHLTVLVTLPWLHCNSLSGSQCPLTISNLLANSGSGAYMQIGKWHITLWSGTPVRWTGVTTFCIVRWHNRRMQFTIFYTTKCLYIIFFIFSERELRFTFAICYRPSVCLSSVTFVRPAQAVQIFGNISKALGTLAIHWHPLKISRRSSQGNPSAGGIKHKRGSQV